MPKERFHEKLMEVLKTHPDFLDDEKGELLRAAVINRAWQLDHSLLHFQQACGVQGVEEIAGIFSLQHPYVKRLIAAGDSTLVSTTDTTMRFYAVDPFVFLCRLVSVLKQQNL